MDGDPVWRDQEGAFVLPLGTLTVEETKAPEGYNQSGDIQLCRITGEGEGQSMWETYEIPVFPGGDHPGVTWRSSKSIRTRMRRTMCWTASAAWSFTITSKTTGKEVLTIVTDREGKATTKSEEQPPWSTCVRHLHRDRDKDAGRV